ncbi:MAG: hypothetical protein HRU19_13285 [Pseudobacteriovorax sp.]|nr:hypothetical protein [Pseudobacteriovorax sp.]
MLSIPHDSFSSSLGQDLSPLTTKMMDMPQNSYLNKNRFIGADLVFSLSGRETSQLGLYKSGTAELITRDLPQGEMYLSRLETLSDSMGVGFFQVLDKTTNQYRMDAYRFDTTNFALDTILPLGAMREGESRSHGFFAKAQEDGSTLMALPVVSMTENRGWWGSGVSNLLFLRSNETNGLSLSGGISSQGDTTICETSCVDWYGNTRPIFLRERIFALMGNEFVEGSLVDGNIAKAGESLFLNPETTE